MDILKKTNELEIHYLDKVVKLRGHQDDDVFAAFEKDGVSKISLTESDRKAMIREFEKRGDIIID